MDSPEGDVFAIQSGTMEPLPLYVEQESELSGLQALIAALPTSRLHPLDRDVLNTFVESQAQVQAGPKKAGAPEPIKEYPGEPYRKSTDELMAVRQAIVTGFFDAISKGQDEAIALFINNNLVTANTTIWSGTTPLLAAVATKDVGIVQELLDFGADPNAFGVEVFIRRFCLSFGSLIPMTGVHGALPSSIWHGDQTYPVAASRLHRTPPPRQAPHGSLSLRRFPSRSRWANRAPSRRRERPPRSR